MKKEGNLSYFLVGKKLLVSAFFAAPFWMLTDCVGMILSSTCHVLGAISMQNMFDAVNLTINGQMEYQALIAAVVIMIAVLVFNELLNAMCNFIAGPTGMKVSGVFNREIHNKIARLPAIDFEDAETLDCITKAKEGAENAVELYYSVSTLVTFYTPYFIVMGIYLYSLRPILALGIFFVFIPSIISQLIKDRIYSKVIDDSAPLERKLKYYENEIYGRDYFKETRILGTYTFVRAKYEKTMDVFCKIRWKAIKHVQLIEIGLRFFNLLGYLGMLILMFNSLVSGYISVGSFAAIFASVGIVMAFMNDAISNYLGDMLENFGSLRNYVKFLNLPEETGRDVNLDYSEGIHVENVTFQYPNSAENALENVSLFIKAGETVALVGENGAGKTTLVRLMTGILSPTKGDIKVDGTSLQEFSKESRFRNVSGVMQKFGRYKMSLKDNVALSNGSRNMDEMKLNNAIEKSGFKIDDKLPEGINTMLSREFNGSDLSGGQWQKVALARSLYKDSKLVILDEPTSAIDPIEESLLYKKFRKFSVGKTSIIVTHRLGSAKIADWIVVFDKGRIAETGTHKELMDMEGLYAQMYHSQAKWYAR